MTATQAFFHLLWSLQHVTNVDCTAYHSNIIGGGEGGGVTPVVNTPVYEGSCVQSLLLVLQHYATYFSFNG